MKKTNCPSCGRVVLLDDAKLEAHHQAPMCDGWRKLMAETRGEGAGALIVTKQGAERIEPIRGNRS